jgi:hypothetical protein
MVHRRAVLSLDHRRLGAEARDCIGNRVSMIKVAMTRTDEVFGTRNVRPRGQHLRGRRPAPGRCDKQPSRGLDQAERVGQQPGGVFMRRPVNPALQVTDSPRANLRRLRQLLLRQPRLQAQLPQEPGETQRGLVGHGLPSPQTLRPQLAGTARKARTQRTRAREPLTIRSPRPAAK